MNSTSYDIIGTFCPTIGRGCRKNLKIFAFPLSALSGSERCFHSTCLQHIPEGYSNIPSGNIAMESMNIHMFIRKYIFVAGPCSIASLGSHAGGYMKPSRMCPLRTSQPWLLNSRGANHENPGSKWTVYTPPKFSATDWFLEDSLTFFQSIKSGYLYIYIYILYIYYVKA